MTTVREWTGREATLLRAALRLSIRDFAAKLGVDIRTVTKWQARGTEVVLRPHMQAVLDTALDQGGEAAAIRFADILREDGARFGSSTPRDRSGSVRDVDRHQFLRASGTILALPWLDLFGATEPTPVPVKVGRVEIECIRTAAKVFSSWDNAYGGGLARETVITQLRWSAQILNADCPEKLRPELVAAVASLSTVAGFMAFDAGFQNDARRAFRFGLACAEQSGNWHVQSCLLGDMAVQAMDSGRLDEALTHAERAMTRPEQLTAPEQARLHTVRARAHAKLHRAPDAFAAIRDADEALDAASGSTDGSWEFAYDDAWHRGHTGQALFDLAMAGRKTQAGAHLSYAIARHEPGAIRARTTARTKYATLLMATGDPREGAAIGHKALDDAGSLRSRRVVDDLRTLQRFAGRHPKVAETVELQQRIDEVVQYS